MVSKISKRTPTKSIKDCRSSSQKRRRHRRKSPAKNGAVAASSSVIASINKSLLTCHRRLIQLFSKLARISTPNRSHKGYKILTKIPQPENTVCKSLVFDNDNPTHLPLLLSPKRTVFLDLDETLIHSKTDPAPDRFDFMVSPRIDGEVVNFYVLKRPGVDELLAALGKRFEVVIFTAGLREYASLVLDRLDQDAVISHRLYRDSCKQVDGKFVKDLLGLGRDLSRVVIVDDNPNAYVFQPENAIPIRPFTDDLGDTELGKLTEFFEGSDVFEDMRDAVKHYVTAIHTDCTI
ncbi:hypothetical protein I3760_09G133600 [Carya illinoinensis]|nr:hypothetical protein I3760_09G133600 [Carya illinoinensis]